MVENVYLVSKHSYATHGQRAGNYIIDNFVLVLIVMAVFYLNASYGDGSYIQSFQRIGFWGQYFFFTFMEPVYYMIVELTFGTTLGKLATRTRIVDAYGEKPYKQYFVLRSLARMIPLERFSFLTAFCRGWHDKLSNTYVVDVEDFTKEKEAFYQNQKTNDNN